MKVAVIGYGHRMEEVMRKIKDCNQNVTVVAVTDPRQEQVQKVLAEDGFPQGTTFYSDADEMLDAVSADAVLIGTRCSLHAQMAQKVLRRRLPLFLEKPIATSLSDAIDLYRAYVEGGKPRVVVSFPLRVTTPALHAKRIVQSGQLGEIVQVQAVNNVPYGQGYFHRWYRDENETGGLFLQKATHDLDCINDLLGLAPVQVCAMTSKQIFRGDMPEGSTCNACGRQEDCTESPANLLKNFGEKRRDVGCCFARDTGNEDSGSMIVRYEGGLHAVYTQNFVVRKAAGSRKIRLIGYLGTLEFDWYTAELKVFMHDSGRVETHTFPADDENHWGGDATLAQNFVGCVTKGAASVSPLEAGMESTAVCLAARESAQTNQFVDVFPWRNL